MVASRWVTNIERLLESTPFLSSRSAPEHFRIESYGGHGGPAGVVVRGRVLDNPESSRAAEGEGVGAAVRRSVQNFLTRELPGVPLRIRIGDVTVDAVSDADGYVVARIDSPAPAGAPWAAGTISLGADYRGVTEPHSTVVDVRVPDPGARFGIISDIDDTVIETGVQRAGQMVLQTFAGSELTRVAFDGAADLYRDLAGSGNPVFYVSSSPWNLHGFLTAFLDHHGFPRGPVLLRDLLGTSAGREAKHGRIHEILDLHLDLPFVLIGDSGEKDPEIYADIVRSYPGRILAVYIREVRLDPGDGRVEKVSDAWGPDVPFVLAADTDAVRRHAQGLGLL